MCLARSLLHSSASYLPRRHDQVLDREKRRSLSREKYQTTAPMDHAPGWNEHLATTSEHAVKVRHSITFINRSGDILTSSSSHAALLSKLLPQADATPGGPPSEDLAAQTVQHLQKKHSPEERFTSEAVYERDEISGPLGTAKIQADASEEVGRVDGEWRKTVVQERKEEVTKPTDSEEHVCAISSPHTK